MKKFKFIIASALICTMSYVSYISYEKLTTSEDEKFMLANIEALTDPESDVTLVICRCHTDLNCYGGNAISFRPQCGKVAVGVGGAGNCRSADSACKNLN